MTPTSNPRKGVRGTLNLEGDTLRFTPAATGHIGFRVAPNEVVAARKAPSSPVIELHLSSYPKEVLLYFAEPSSSLDWTSLYDLAFADVFLGDAVKQWLWAILHPQPERVTPGWTLSQNDRLEELEQVREQRGLSLEEANELGQLYAEREGKEYGNVETRPHPDLDRTERPWRWADVNTPAEGSAWYAGTAGVKPSELARQVLGKRPPPHGRDR